MIQRARFLLLFALPLLALAGADCSTGGPDAGDGDIGDGDIGDGDGDGDGVQAIIAADESMTFGDALTLDGSASVHPTGGLLTFAWSLDSAPPSEVGGTCDGALTDTTAQVATFSPLCAGSYTVQLIVLSSTGESDTASHVVEVSRPAELTAQIAPISAWRGFNAVLSGSYDGAFGTVTTSWSVTPPMGCEASIGDADALTTTLNAQCPGPHGLTLRVEDDIGAREASATVDVAQSVVLSVSGLTSPAATVPTELLFSIDPASVPDATPLNATIEVAIVPPGPATAPTLTETLVAALDSTWTLTALTREDFQLSAAATYAGVAVPAPLIVDITVLNSLPTATLLVPEPAVAIGEVATVTAVVEDLDGDTVQCSFAAQAGYITGTAGPVANLTDGQADLAADDSVCTATFDLPDGIADGWPVTVTLDDGFDIVTVGPTTLCPGDNLPTVTGVDVDAAAAYTCGAAGCATTGAVTVTVTGTDVEDDDSLLDYALVLVGQPAGTDEVVVAGLDAEVSPGVFELTFSRPDLGPISGDWVVVAEVRDQSSCAAEGLVGRSAPFDIVVANAPPTVTVTSADDAPHSYLAGTDTYESDLLLTFDVADPEGNLLADNISVQVVGCAGGDATACDDSALTIVATASAPVAPGASSAAGTASYALTSTDLGALAGDWAIEVVAEDVDSGQTTLIETLAVLNSAPTIATDVRVIEQQYAGNDRHEVIFSFGASDADGDPIFFQGVNVTWAGGPLDLPGTLGPDVSATFDQATATVTIDSVPANLLGVHVVGGTVSDGADGPSGVLFDIDVRNTPPVLAAPVLIQNRNHIYDNGNVRVDPAENLFNYTGAVSDPNGDPVRWELTPGPSGLNYAVQDPDVAGGAYIVYDGSEVVWTFDIDDTHANYLAESGVTLKVDVLDPFDARTGGHTIQANLLNRQSSGVLTSSQINGDGPGDFENHVLWQADSVDTVGLVAVRKTRGWMEDGCLATNGCDPLPVPLYMQTDVGPDPDGDPLTVSVLHLCTDGQKLEGFPVTVELPSGATSVRTDLALEGANDSCSSYFDIILQDTRWGDRVDLEFVGVGNWAVRCDVSWNLLTDGKDNLTQSHSVDADSIPDESVGDTCP